MVLVDTHAHLYSSKFNADREAMIERAREAGVAAVVLPAIDLPSIELALELCERYAFMYAMTALHPSHTKEATDADFDAVAAYCDHPKVVAVGESGLDYYWDRTFDDRQQAFFRRHIQLAIETDLPLVLHNREASADLVRILREERAASDRPGRLRGIFHCFGGPADLAEEALALNFHLGLGGTLTFKNSGVADAVRGVSLDRLVLETDAPYLAPVPFRGRRNESAYVVHVAEKLAEVKAMSVDEIARITTENAMALFELPGLA